MNFYFQGNDTFDKNDLIYFEIDNINEYLMTLKLEVRDILVTLERILSIEVVNFCWNYWIFVIIRTLIKYKFLELITFFEELWRNLQRKVKL